METGPWLKVSSDRLEKPGIKPATPGSQGKCLSTTPQRLLAATCDFQQCGILTSVDSDYLCSLLLSLKTPNVVRSVAQQSLNVQGTCKGADQTARMRRLV